MTDVNFIELCAEGTLEEVRAAVDAGASVIAGNDYGLTALLAAAMWNNDIDVIEVLLEAGAEVNAKDNAGRTALMWAVHNRNAEAVSALLDAGAGARARDSDGKTALMLAEEREGCCPEIVDLLRGRAMPMKKPWAASRARRVMTERSAALTASIVNQNKRPKVRIAKRQVICAL
jgi:hypothetical protein